MENYFKLKMFTDYILPFIVALLVIVVAIIYITISAIKSNRIEKFFLSNGYTRELFNTSSFGDNHLYGWIRESDGKRVADNKIKGLSLKQIKEKYK